MHSPVLQYAKYGYNYNMFLFDLETNKFNIYIVNLIFYSAGVQYPMVALPQRPHSKIQYIRLVLWEISSLVNTQSNMVLRLDGKHITS